MIMLGAGNVRAAQTTRNAGLDTLHAGELHRALLRLLQGTAEADALLQLLSDVLRHQLRVRIGLLDLHHVDLRRTAELLGHFCLQLLDGSTLRADNHAGLAGHDVDGHVLSGAFNVDAADAGSIVLFLNHLAKLEVFNQVVGEVLLVRIPAGAPAEDDAHASSVGIDFLTHG